jgi:hypothetical protein
MDRARNARQIVSYAIRCGTTARPRSRDRKTGKKKRRVGASGSRVENSKYERESGRLRDRDAKPKRVRFQLAG